LEGSSCKPSRYPVHPRATPSAPGPLGPPNVGCVGNGRRCSAAWPRLSGCLILSLRPVPVARGRWGSGRITMRIGDLVSALGAVAGLPPKILLTCLVSVFALHGCAGFVTSESTPSAHGQPPVERPVTIR